ncbi:sporulation histidine kinase inhibitor Sda [Domibacillus sp. A3M-37]|uniref:sporulation histidine kinase inhibitor Sda n=1 Tax=Domibacillus TaxID=1433999 RepID=UPI0020B81C16|nr:sporulation histidine kinase inhibitor Sda [Domibacillus sp. A3M-37]MCP3763939.1 sporulation histidine kinase inhibitor Sda [Domibacillus sp. A3M-37]
MENLKISDKDLLAAYTDAVRLKLDEDFIQLLENEIKIRGIVFLDHLPAPPDSLVISV